MVYKGGSAADCTVGVSHHKVHERCPAFRDHPVPVRLIKGYAFEKALLHRIGKIAAAYPAVVQMPVYL